MGEAARRLAALYLSGPWPGGPACCPRCLGLRVRCEAAPSGVDFYGRQIAICGDCGTAWEPIDEASIWDRSDPSCCSKEPCDKCAFRPGSPEQRDTEKWKALIANLRAGAVFHCHKGVPIAPRSEHGFDYPKDRAKLRLCRGYLDALGKWWKADEASP